MNLGQVAKMVQGTARGGGPTTWVRRSPWGGAVGRFWNPENEDSVLGAAVRRARRRRRQPRRDRVEGAARVRRIAQGQGLRQDRHAEHRRQHRDRQRRCIFIGATIDCRFRAFESRTGKQLWETELAGVRALHADDVPRQGRPPVRRRRRRRRQLSRRGARDEDRRLRAAALPARRQVTVAVRRSPLAIAVLRPRCLPRRRRPAPREARAGLGRRAQRLSARFDLARAGDDRTARPRIGRLRHVHPHRLAARSPSSRSRFRPAPASPPAKQFNVRNLNYFDAIFFFGVREIDLVARAARRPAVVRQGRRQGVRGGAFGGRRRSSRGRSSARCSAAASTSTRGTSPTARWWSTIRSFPAMRHLPKTFVLRDELYQMKDFSRDKVRVLAHLDPAQARSDAAAGPSHGRRLSRSRGRRPTARAGCSIRFSGTTRRHGTIRCCSRCTSRPSAGPFGWSTATRRHNRESVEPARRRTSSRRERR